MATKPIKKYFKEEEDAYNKVRQGSHKVKVKGKGIGRQYKTKQVREWMEKGDDNRRLEKKKPKGMSDAEWARQLKSGEAMVQNIVRSKRSKPSWSSHGMKKIKPSGPKKPKEFIITTKREPKKIKNPKQMGKSRSEFEQKQERIMREEAAYEKAKDKASARAKAKAVLKRMKAKKKGSY